MSDNVPKDLCEQRMNAQLLRLPPTEVWTDIFKLLPRRTLVQRVQPVCLWFKAICDKNVKSIHVIRAIGFIIREPMMAQSELEALAGHNCQLAEHFRMTNFLMYYHDRNEAILALLRHALDLFRRCQLIIFPQAHCQLLFCSSHALVKHSLACLTLLEPVKPSFIQIKLQQVDLNEFELAELLLHPTTLNCPRLKLSEFRAWPNRQAIFDWLHHRQVVDMEELNEDMMRCLNLNSGHYHQDKRFDEWLVGVCVQNFEQSKVPEDRRCFVLTFFHHANVLHNFERKNPATGEVLLLERLMSKWDGYPTGYYRLLRCLASQVASSGKEQLYAKLFEPRYGIDVNNLERAADVAKVQIF